MRARTWARRLTRWQVLGTTVLVPLAAASLVAKGAVADFTITEYPTTGGGEPLGIAKGPDGNPWFTRSDDGRIGTITPGGAITTYVLPSVGNGTGQNIGPSGITSGPDGNLWFLEEDVPNSHGIGKITPSGVATEYALPNDGTNPTGIVAEPDGKIWYGHDGANGTPSLVSHINTDGTGIVDIPLTNNASVKSLTVGPDGKIWFTETNLGKVGRIDPAVGAASYVEFPVVAALHDGLNSITKGPDGNLWFTSGGSNQVGSVTPDGATVKTYNIPTATAEPESITTGPDGNLWFAEADQDQVASVSTAGVFHEYPIPNRTSNPPPGRNDRQDVHQVVAGADGNMWFTEGGQNSEAPIDPGGAIGKIQLPVKAVAVPTPSPSSPLLPATGIPPAGPTAWWAYPAGLAAILALASLGVARIRSRA